MNIFDVIILSIIEGITEFLPISSTGHLVLVARLLAIPQTDFAKSFEIIIQLGAILAVVVLYWKRLVQNRTVWWRILAAFLPTGILGLVFYKIIKHYLLGNEIVTLTALFIGGIALIAIELLHKEKEHGIDTIERMSIKKAFFIGLFQSLSMIPGMSRAAATIVGGMLLGMKRKTAVEFSFFLAIPTMLAASGYDVLKSGFAFSSEEYFLLSLGFIGSFLVAIVAIKFFISFVQKHTFIPFGIYRIVLAILYWFFIIR